VAPVVGVLADRLGRRAVLVPCLGLFGAAGLFVATAPTFTAMLIARFVMGFGAAGLINLAVVLISDTFPDDQRTYWIGKNVGVLTAALAIFPMISGFITDAAGWRWALAPYGLGLVTAAATWLVLDAERPATGLTIREQLSGLGTALRHPTIVTTLVAGSLSFAVMFGVFLTVLPNHLEGEFGLSAGWRGVVIGLPAITSSLAAFNLGRIRRRVPTGSLLIAAAAIWVVAFALAGAATALVVLVIGTLLYGLGEGVLIPSLQDTALVHAPDEHRAAVVASWTGAARLGQTIGPLAAGVILSGAGTAWALLAGSLTAAVLVVIFALTDIRTSR
jgi:MFS family permease